MLSATNGHVLPPFASILSQRDSTGSALADSEPNLLCPILALPVEITSEIFLHCVLAHLPVEHTLQPTPSSPSDKPPLLLTRICRQWRMIALSMPELWCHVALEFRASRGLRRGYLDSWWVSFLHRWFDRAQNQPLSILISDSTYVEPDEGLVLLLDRHRQRWRDVTINLPFNQFYRFSSSESMPKLQRLALDAFNVPHTPAVVDPITAFQHAPALEHLFLGYSLRPSQFILPWEQLTTLELINSTAEDCLNCLRQTPKLTTCSVEVEDSITGMHSAVPALRRLTALTVRGSVPTFIFSYITLPSLEALDLSGRSLMEDELSGARTLIERSQAQLRRLRIYFIAQILTTPALQLLQALPALAALDLDATEASTLAGLFRRLAADGSFLPQLERLALTHHRVHDENTAAMLCALTDALVRRAARSPEHVQLCAVSLLVGHGETTPEPWMLPLWWELVDRGMALNIRTRHDRWI
ncbi:hypothetical protein GGX14DRAFT_528448 [Mycena pura]|uniref:F-box domain-containing protein n=1 Tax=Mycena pura TaxID=153505 RepID=A0AAD6Y5C6_9AGAR|nr:hypothetical protein GGX14DRAFT_528448 [Mycena pura]